MRHDRILYKYVYTSKSQTYYRGHSWASAAVSLATVLSRIRLRSNWPGPRTGTGKAGPRLETCIGLRVSTDPACVRFDKRRLSKVRISHFDCIVVEVTEGPRVDFAEFEWLVVPARREQDGQAGP